MSFALGADGACIRIGALAPLSPPGWTEAGRNLLAGMRCAVCDINTAGGIAGRALELIVRDTAAGPLAAARAVEELARLGVVALAGEYHSVVARAAAAASIANNLPFLCSSAVLDNLVDQQTDLVARIAPMQSNGWRVFARYLAAEGHRRVAVATAAGAYWSAGENILREELSNWGGAVIRLDVSILSPTDVAHALAHGPASVLLLLTGYPEPAMALVRKVRRDPRLKNIRLAAPAGQPEFADWIETLGSDGAAIPFLRYMPDCLTEIGQGADRRLRVKFSKARSFVAFEGYDTIAVLADMLRGECRRSSGRAGYWGSAKVLGTRGSISFRQNAASSIWEHQTPPIQIVERDKGDLGSFRVVGASYPA